MPTIFKIVCLIRHYILFLRRLGPMSSQIYLHSESLVVRIGYSFLKMSKIPQRGKSSHSYLQATMRMLRRTGCLILILEMSFFGRMSNLMSTFLKWILHHQILSSSLEDEADAPYIPPPLDIQPLPKWASNTIDIDRSLEGNPSNSLYSCIDNRFYYFD